MNPDLRDLLEAARRAAREAAPAILAIYATAFDVRKKADASPVTAADEEAERIVIAALAKAAPGIPAIAEEMVSADGAGTPPPRYWLIDPVDGTREFVARNGEFCTNIGLVEETKPVLGVIHVPVKNITYAAAGFGTATKQIGDAAPVPITARPVPARGPIVAHSRSHSDSKRLDAYLATLDAATTLISGSAVKFCLLAEGTADLYPRFGPTSEWDTAAGQAILEAAGGSVTTLDGASLAYAKPGYRNPDFMARGRSSPGLLRPGL
jgi:3'(2'), 5'-bisphosphate nucleotidase